MGTLTIRNLDDDLKRELRKRAAEHGVSMEQEARDSLARDIAAGRQRRKPSIEEMSRLAMKPTEPFDLKKISDDMWDESFR